MAVRDELFLGISGTVERKLIYDVPHDELDEETRQQIEDFNQKEEKN